MRRSPVVCASLLAALWALVLAACPGPEAATTCISDTECLPGAGCVDGSCRSCPACAAGEVCLRGRCLPSACGERPCRQGEACVEGTCRAADCVSMSCPAGQACARGSCYPVDCGEGVCEQGDVCWQASCAQPSCVEVRCAGDQVCAAGECLPGACSGVACEPGSACVDGRCQSTRCVGVACAEGLGCQDGACRGCAEGQRLCGQVCAACCADSDCGAVVGQTCQAGVCACAASEKVCDAWCIAREGCCEDSDCAAIEGQTCQANQCACPAGRKVCGDRCAPCCSSVECTAVTGQVCAAGGCTCPPGQKACKGSCIDQAEACCTQSLSNGNFGFGLACWQTVSAAPGTFTGYPRMACVGGENCIAGRAGDAAAYVDVPGGADGWIEQTFLVPAGNPVQLSFVSWGAVDPVTVTVRLEPKGGTEQVLESYSPPTLRTSSGACSGSGGPVTKTYDLTVWAGTFVTLRLRATSGGMVGTFALFDDVVLQ